MSGLAERASKAGWDLTASPTSPGAAKVSGGVAALAWRRSHCTKCVSSVPLMQEMYEAGRVMSMMVDM
eukprot:15446255-Alexandrium_andersonii.AAC.1